MKDILNFHKAATIAQLGYSDVDLHNIAELQRDLEGPICGDCGGIQPCDTTPGYLFKEKDICDCGPQGYRCPVCHEYFSANTHGYAPSCDCVEAE